MTAVRLIARLDVKAPNLIKGVRMEGLRQLGSPIEFAERYYRGGADELIYLDAVASLYDRNTIESLVSDTAAGLLVPLTVGGGVRTIEDFEALLRSGADKIAVNTAAIRNPDFIDAAVRCFGSQCFVLSVEAKRRQNGSWEAYTDGGREHSGRNVTEWIVNGGVNPVHRAE